MSTYQEDLCRQECYETAGCHYYTWYGQTDFLAFTCLLLSSCDQTDTSCTSCHSGPPQCSQALPASSTSSPVSELQGLMISGGYSAGASTSVEFFLPQSGLHCQLPEVSGERFAAHSASNLTLCGGDFTRSLCVSLTPTGWLATTHLVRERFYHSAWDSPSGLRLLGSAVLANLKTTEVIRPDGTSEESFTLQYNTE